MIGENDPLLDSLFGGNFNGLAIPPGGLVRVHMTLSMVEGVYIEEGDILDELGQQNEKHKGGY